MNQFNEGLFYSLVEYDLDMFEFDYVIGGWGLFEGVVRIYGIEYSFFMVFKVLVKFNKLKGVMCFFCVWVKLVKIKIFEFCENGVKVMFWEIILKCVML